MKQICAVLLCLMSSAVFAQVTPSNQNRDVVQIEAVVEAFRTAIDGIVAAKERQEEKFRNVKIETDGDIASVTSDYSFHQIDRETNRGQEAWHLVRTDDGWKIASVIWSVNRTSVPPQTN